MERQIPRGGVRVDYTLARLESFEVAGPVERLSSNVNGGLKHLPVITSYSIHYTKLYDFASKMSPKVSQPASSRFIARIAGKCRGRRGAMIGITPRGRNNFV